MSFCNQLVHITYIVVEISSTPALLSGGLRFKIWARHCYSEFICFLSSYIEVL